MKYIIALIIAIIVTVAYSDWDDLKVGIGKEARETITSK